VNTNIAAGPEVTFTLDAPATVLLEYGGVLVATSRGNTGFGVAMDFQPAVDGAAPFGHQAGLSLNDQQDPTSPFTTGQASVMTTDAVDLGTGRHTVQLFVSGTTLQCVALFPWLKVSKL
jgi:hypothetical protein